jgi:hypothetical protein
MGSGALARVISRACQPLTADADGDQQYSGAGQVTTELAFEALTNPHRIEVRVGRLLQRAAQGCAQLLGVFCQARTCSAMGALPER